MNETPNTRAALVTRIEAFCARTGMSERAFCIAAMRDHKFMLRLRNGRVTLGLMEKAEAYMDSFDSRCEEGATVELSPPVHYGVT